MEGLGWGPADKPDAFLAEGVEETGDFPEANLGYPGFDLPYRGATGGEDDEGFFGGYPPGFDPGQAFLPRVGVHPKIQPSFG